MNRIARYILPTFLSFILSTFFVFTPLESPVLSLTGFKVYAEKPSHIDTFKVSITCTACHSPHGKRGTPSLRKTVPDLCFDCHSPTGDRLYTASTEVYYSIQKRYRHPVVETAQYHAAGEALPEEDVSTPRHVSCLDCHNPHMSEKNDPLKNVPGHSAKGMKKLRAEKESEVCYKCHADSQNKPFSSPNTRHDFDSSNASYHPVEKAARGRSISLMASIMRGKLIECTDCHEPHGSDYKYMLRYNYSDVDGPETMFAYELCYTCHQRNSIIGDQSFKEHRRHIVFESTSCSTCHNAHGSRDNRRLIEFNTSIVRPNKTGMLNYMKTGQENSCFLNCHGVEHAGDTIEKLVTK